MLMPLELSAFDLFLTKVRGHNQPADDRLRIIEITREDIQQHEKEPGGYRVLPDRQFKALLDQLNKAENRPRVIGLDVYYSPPANSPPANPEFNWTEALTQAKQLIGICKRPQLDKDQQIKDEGISPPPSELVPSERIGFSDFLTDAHGIVRRQFLTAPIPTSTSKNGCMARDAFSLLIANEYLKAAGYSYVRPHRQEDSKLFSNVTFPQIGSWWGGYQGIETGEYQTLLKYRAVGSSPRKIAESMSLGKFVTGLAPAGWTKDKIVLIGLTDEYADRRDIVLTPYGEMPGVIVHAHMVSQILDAVLDQKPLLWVFPQWAEALWIGIWCLLGGILVCCFRSPRILLLVGGAMTLLLLVICAIYLASLSAWIPLVPPVLGLWASGVIVYSKCLSSNSLTSASG